ncbi:hypothetical protein BDY21DRAFT_200215 [Lineolata rhizophorae]|uniref:Uncharacterized protein n=1 Tax=Lineolata rhizophorae TaxID=578093 RepID=A0A6A6P6J2_9PEZI|nr:hypothetical protein BDY21DRAFT_200215 [Lineolata rhizophorae]
MPKVPPSFGPLHDDDLELLEHARHSGLCRDHFAFDILCDDGFGLWNDGSLGTSDVGRLEPENFRIPSSNARPELERLSVDRLTALFLRSALQDPGSILPFHSSASEIPRGPRARTRLELPLLRTDNEFDIIHFGQHQDPCTVDHRIPLEYVDEENDEGLRWPERRFQQARETSVAANTEKLVIRASAIDLLRSSVRPDVGQIRLETETLLNQRSTRIKVPIRGTITPPLVPNSSPLATCVPSTPECDMIFSLDDTAFTAGATEQLETTIFDADNIKRDKWNQDVNSDLPIRDILGQNLQSSPPENPLLSSRNGKRRISDLRVENPLTPPSSTEPPWKKTKSGMLVDELDNLESGAREGLNLLEKTSSKNYNSMIVDMFDPLQMDTSGPIEQEQLNQADSTSRVHVPIVDFSLPVVSWGDRNTTAHNQMEAKTDIGKCPDLWLREDFVSAVMRWHGLAIMERQLSWTPLPHNFENPCLSERMEEAESLSNLLSRMQADEIVTIDSLSWKSPGLRILEFDRSSDTDSELDDRWWFEADIVQPASGHPPISQNGCHGSRIYLTSQPTSSLFASPTRVASKFGIENASETEYRKGDPSFEFKAPQFGFGWSFSAGREISRFMALHQDGNIIRRNIDTTVTSQSVLAKTTNDCTMERSLGSDSKFDHRRYHTNIPWPSWFFDLPKQTFVVSSSFMSHRSIFRAIQNRYPQAGWVEREIAAGKDLIGQTLSMGGPSLLGFESDICISPSAGLICTSMQLLRQRSLPGQAPRIGIRERVLLTARKYERILLLADDSISTRMDDYGIHCQIDAHAALTEECAESLAEFSGLLSQVDADVHFMYVAGDNGMMARWIVGTMARFRMSQECTTRDEETSWEHVLRRAGLNSCAAQLVIGRVKRELSRSSLAADVAYPSQDVNKQVSGHRGKSAIRVFVEMGSAERTRAFSNVMCGEQVLRRVNQALDQTWESAAIL